MRTEKPDWHPILLRVPQQLRAVRAARLWDWLRTRRLTVLTLLTLFLACQFLIPARLVIRGMGAAGRPSVAVGVAIAFLWLVSALRPHGLPSGRQPIRWAVGIYAGVQLIGHAVGFDRLPTAAQASSADRWIIVWVSFAGVTLAVADGLRTRSQVDRLLRILLLFGSVLSVVGLLQFFADIDLTRYIRIPGLRLNSDLIGVTTRGELDIPRVMGTANHYIEFGVVLALLLPLALHYVLFAPPGRSRIWRWTVLALIGLGIPLSISRSAIVTAAVALLWLMAVWTWRQRYNALVLGVLAVSVFHIVNRGVLGTIKALFTEAENDPSVTARIERGPIVMKLWRERPVLGWGAGMVTPEEFLLLDNQLYKSLLAGGAVGLVAFLLLFLIPYVVGRSVRLRAADEATRQLGQVLATTMAAMVVVSATFDTFSFGTFMATAAILIGSAGALWRTAGIDLTRPLRVADPGDHIVATPIMAEPRRRIRAAWQTWAPTRTLSRRSGMCHPVPNERSVGGEHRPEPPR